MKFKLLPLNEKAQDELARLDVICQEARIFEELIVKLISSRR